MTSEEPRPEPIEYTVPASVRAELLQLRAERSVLMAERERLHGQVRRAEMDLRESLRVQEQLAAQANESAELRRRLDEVSETRVELDALRRDRDLAIQQLERTRTERDQLRMDLLQAELILHGKAPADVPVSQDGSKEPEILRRRMAELAAHNSHLHQELEAHRNTVSWKVTAPLRTVRRRSR